MTNTKPEGSSPKYTEGEVCGYRHKPVGKRLDLKCAAPKKGQYVMIQHQFKEYLTLCEVEVYSGERKLYNNLYHSTDQ